MQVNFESQKSTYRWDKINPHGSWWYIQVLWSEMTGLCKKLNIISNTIICNPEPQANSPEWCPDHERIILLNRFFLVNQSAKLDWISLWLEQHSTSYSIKTHFQTFKKKKFSQLLIFYSADWKWGTEETVRTLELRGEIKDFMVSHGYVKRWID